MSILPTKNDPNVTQNRNMYVGGSDVPTILGLNKYKTQFELAQEKVGIKKSEFKGNEYTQYGNILEPQIRDYINAVNETNFAEKSLVSHKYNIRSNVDGYDEEYGLLLEIKTHGKNPTLKVYEAQMQLYMWHLDIEEGWLALYERPDNFDAEFDLERLDIRVIKRDDEYIQKILDAIEKFWIRCEFLRENPEATEQEYYNFGQNEVAVIANKVGRLERQLAGFKELEKQYKEAKQELYEKMEEYDIKKFETDHIVITRVLPGFSNRFDSTTFKKEHHDLYAQYQKKTEKKGYVTIKLKEAN